MLYIYIFAGTEEELLNTCIMTSCVMAYYKFGLQLGHGLKEFDSCTIYCWLFPCPTVRWKTYIGTNLIVCEKLIYSNLTFNGSTLWSSHHLFRVQCALKKANAMAWDP
jgi:hypothetical protein